MAELETFSPGYGSGITITAGATSSAATALRGGLSNTLCITNYGTDRAFVRVGGETVQAVTDQDYCVLGGQQVTITIPITATHVAVIAPSGTPTLQFLRGEGI